MNDPRPLPQMSEPKIWKTEGTSRVPFWLYTDEDIYQRELERLFYGPHWSYLGLSCEIPNPGDFKRTWIGERNVLMVRDENGLRKLQVTERNGVVFASFDPDVEDFETFLGPTMLKYFDRVFNGCKLTVLGYNRQRVPGNWKLIHENLKDCYHPGLLHTWFVNFGLWRADNECENVMDEQPERRHSQHFPQFDYSAAD